MTKKIKNKLNSVKTIQALSVYSYDWYMSDNRHFSFSFTKMPQGKYSIENVPKEDLFQLIKQLRILSQMTWGEIKLSGRHQLGSEIISHASLKTSLPNDVSEDTKILAFRYFGKKPFLGYRRGKIFHILYVDFDFSVYNHN